MSLAPDSAPTVPRARTESVRKPTSTLEVRSLVSRAVTALRRIQAIDARREARIAYYQQKIEDLKSASSTKRDVQVALIRRIMPRVHDYVEAHRFEMTNGNRRKTVGFPDGLYRWQPCQSTDIPDTEAFLKEVRRLKLTDTFIRVKEEPNRLALLDESNSDKAAKLTTARIVKETRPQLVTPGTSLKIERVKGEQEGEFHWRVVDSRQN